MQGFAESILWAICFGYNTRPRLSQKPRKIVMSLPYHSFTSHRIFAKVKRRLDFGIALQDICHFLGHCILRPPNSPLKSASKQRKFQFLVSPFCNSVLCIYDGVFCVWDGTFGILDGEFAIWDGIYSINDGNDYNCQKIIIFSYDE